MRTEWRGATFPAAAVGNRAVGRGGDRRKSPQVVRVLVGEKQGPGGDAVSGAVEE